VTTTTAPAIGDLLRRWRRRRRLTQLDLALRAGVSTRHLSYVETGRSQPSRDMVVHLAEVLDVPLRERNALLLAAGYAPVYPERELSAPAMAPVRGAIDRLLAAHEPYPAVVVDRWWDLHHANASVALLLEGVAGALLEGTPNVVRIALHPEGLAPRIRNLGRFRAHVLGRLASQVEQTGDHRLGALLEECRGLTPAPPTAAPVDRSEVAVPLLLRSSAGDLNLLSIIATFGTPLDVTVADLSIEAFYPADEPTRRRLLDAAQRRAAPEAR
jgi:transcriptional regulator with XRE-family HTH domain